jgi:thiamine monophosphate kinase
VLGLAKDLDQIAAQDEIGHRLSDIALPQRPRRTGVSRDRERDS